ncbi:hypothetical protein PR202_gb26200 [Eleusine coracana subsp. coracana]|uniref:Uncharacterized protein n=1 Tax=Eleusine coracana subsp. coracana TaxID=191504 RepID=A0AAV5FR86_ELECO|nr:hypothetical protein PR202_gb26200 [Eleusine coracana subsp. coracana]
MNKIRKGYLWKGRKEVNGGCCLVAWDKVQQPLDLGGLGIPDLQVMGWALQIRWLWLRKTDSNKPWFGLDIPVHANAVAMFEIAMQSVVGNGNNSFFWKDRWFNGSSVADIAPLVVAAVPNQIRNSRLVLEALTDLSWTQNIQGGLSLVGLYELFQLADIISELVLTETDDTHVWRLDASG